MIYDETTTEVYIDKQERINQKRSNNHDTDKSDIYLDKTKQELQRKNQAEQEVRKRTYEGNCRKRRKGKNSESQKDLKSKKILKGNMQKKPQCKRGMLILVRS